MPNHDDANFHGKALRVNLDDFSTTHVVDYQPSPKDAQGGPSRAPCPTARALWRGAAASWAHVVGSKDLFGYAYHVDNSDQHGGAPAAVHRGAAAAGRAAVPRVGDNGARAPCLLLSYPSPTTDAISQLEVLFAIPLMMMI